MMEENKKYVHDVKRNSFAILKIFQLARVHKLH